MHNQTIRNVKVPKPSVEQGIKIAEALAMASVALARHPVTTQRHTHTIQPD
jgi:hypothetical protein